MACMPAAAFAAQTSLAGRCKNAIQMAMAQLPPGPILLNSFVVDTGPNKSDFDITQANAAYVYDNALAGLALLASGDRAGAARIGRALELAQQQDRYWKDGRLRNSYQAGPMSDPAKLPGWWDETAKTWREDPYQVGSETGPVAWAMLLWTKLGQTDAANRAGNWLDDKLRAAKGYYGGFYGFEPNPMKLTWQSTEQNTDLFVAFRNLARHDDQNHAGQFVTGMFDKSRGLFNAGEAPNGDANTLLAADAGIWPFLAGLGSAASARSAITSLRRGPGIGFSAASGGTWLEGTAFASLAMQKLDTKTSHGLMTTVDQNIAPVGYVYATVQSELATGLTVGPALQPNKPEQPFNYYRRPALAPTAWAILASLAVNPLAG